MATLDIDLFWSFRSPYSYLATGRLVAMQAEYDLDVRVHPVLPLAVRSDDFFDRVNPLWPGYLVRDIARIAEFHGIALGWPRPDPVTQAMEDGRLRTAKEQPHAHRLTRLGVAAARHGRGLAFLDEVSQIIWNGQVDGWDRGTHLADASARAGLDLAELDAEVASDVAGFDAAIAQNQKDLEAAGHWGVPTCLFEGEPFFGQDRLDLLLWRMGQKGLARREGTEG